MVQNGKMQKYLCVKMTPFTVGSAQCILMVLCKQKTKDNGKQVLILKSHSI